jgi:hypothetical protein
VCCGREDTKQIQGESKNAYFSAVTEYLKKNWKIIFFAGVIALAIFLRVWHFHDWLFFKMDQARDALLAKQALEKGIGWLPLLGPKAGGTAVDLGPAFYYFQYFSAFIFQSSHPAILAYPDLLFSILSIPLFYFFLKKYFSRDWSMILVGLYAVCFLGVEYSRFAWNPNSLVVFNLLYFYALLNIFDEKVRYKYRWFFVAGLSLAISTQLHFLSMATLPATTAVFLVLNWKETRKNLNWKKIAIFLGIILIVYLPVILNDIITHGKNTAAFFAAVKSKPSHHSLWKNILRDIRYWGQYWFLILTSHISKKGDLWPAFAGWLGAIIPGIFLAVRKFKNEGGGIRKKFLLISILWFVAYFIIYIPVAYQIRPRFFLPLLPLPFIFFGYFASCLWEKRRKLLKAAAVVLALVIFFGNLHGTYAWFKEIGPSLKKGVFPKRTIILVARDGIVLWHFEKSLEYVRADCGDQTIYFSSTNEYRSPIKYLLRTSGMKNDSIGNYGTGREGCFYAFGLTRSKGFKMKNKEKYEIISQNKFGALTVYKLQPKDGETFVPAGKKDSEKKRIFWKDVFK